MSQSAWIFVKLLGKRVRRSAKVAHRNGIAVMRSLDNRRRWTLAHQPTGNKFPRVHTHLTLEQARAIAALLAACGDWRDLRSDAPHLVVNEVVDICQTAAEMFGAA
jgi:hypothetical protein